MTRLLIASLLVLFTLPSFAADDVKTQTQQTAQKENDVQGVRDPTLQSTIQGTEEAAKIEAEKGDQNATVKFSFGGTTRRSAHILLSAPVNKNSDQQSLASLHGLTGTAKVEVGYSAFLSTIAATFNDDLADALCKKNGLDPGCDVVKLQAQEPRRAMQAVKFSGMTTAVGVKAELTRTKFDYLTKGTLASNSDSEPQYSGSIAYGALPHLQMPIGVLYFVGVGFHYQSGYEAQKKQQICQPLADTPSAITCSDASIGAPSRALKRVGELRTRFYPNDHLVYDVVVSRDFNKDVTGVEVPVSFIRGKDNLFTGGISIGWRSDTKAVTASIFVGALANLF